MLWLEKKISYLWSCQILTWQNGRTKTHLITGVLIVVIHQKNQYKARGFHFTVEQNFVYKCHNCGKSTSSVHFLKDHFPVVHKEYLKEYLREKGVKPKKPQKMLSSNDFKFKPVVEEKGLLNMKKVENLKAVCHSAWDKHVARDYLLDRKIRRRI